MSDIEKRISELEKEVERLSLLADENETGLSADVEDLEFKLIESKELAHPEGAEKSASTIMIHYSGTITYWRELRIPEGMTRYSHWSFSVKITDKNGKRLTCDYIKIEDCNYRPKQSRTRTETSGANWTTRNKKGWHDLKFKAKVKHKGRLYDFGKLKLER